MHSYYSDHPGGAANGTGGNGVPAGKTARESAKEAIYAAFRSFGTDRNVTIARFLQRLSLDWLQKPKYRHRWFSYDALFKIVLFMKIKGFKSQEDTIEYMRSHKADKRRLGTEYIPDQRTISHFMCHKLDGEGRALVEYVVGECKAISATLGIFLDEVAEKPKPRKEFSSKDFRIKKDQMTNEKTIIAKRWLSAMVDMKVRFNGLYENYSFIELLARMGFMEGCASNAHRSARRSGRPTPNDDTMLYHMKLFENPEAIMKSMDAYLEMVWEKAREAGLFREPVELAIDHTHIHYYGKRNNKTVVGMKPDRGTKFGYKYGSINIVNRGERFMLHTLPCGPFDTDEGAVRSLVNYARERVSIIRIYMDRGFFKKEIIDFLQENKIEYLMPVVEYKGSSLRKDIEMAVCPKVFPNYEWRNSDGKLLCKFNLIVEEIDGQKIPFATNMDVSGDVAELTKRILVLYSRRWGIETGFREVKHAFGLKTTSKNPKVRLFEMLFSFLLYNVWILLNAILFAALGMSKDSDYIITGKEFANMIYEISLDTG
jgi:hypothetical protein